VSVERERLKKRENGQKRKRQKQKRGEGKKTAQNFLSPTFIVETNFFGLNQLGGSEHLQSMRT
jgi:hypothetical protein